MSQSIPNVTIPLSPGNPGVKFQKPVKFRLPWKISGQIPVSRQIRFVKSRGGGGGGGISQSLLPSSLKWSSEIEISEEIVSLAQLTDDYAKRWRTRFDFCLVFTMSLCLLELTLLRLGFRLVVGGGGHKGFCLAVPKRFAVGWWN